ncbi:MAG: hypothetical protein ABEH77_05100 [Halobacteriaceae archaeon]
MDTWLRAEASGGREPPAIEGLRSRDGEWRLRVERYDAFVRDVTGIELAGGLAPRELKTVQCRLEGCLETYERTGHCDCVDLDRYEHVDSMDTVHGLARFFRALVADRIEADPARGPS